jgi:Concanavalin A-like lectin/glucanases superfamily/F5/8 type C domain
MKVLFTLLASIFCINAMAQLPSTASANLSLWLKADAGVSLFPNGDVAQWNDQSGNNRNAGNSGTSWPTLLPGAINGKPALRFTNDRLETPLMDFTTTNAVEVFMVYKTVDNTLSLPMEFGNDINTTSTGFYISDKETGCGGCNGGVNVAINGDVGYNYNAAPQPSTCFKIVNAAMDKSLTTEEVKIWMNNVLQAKAVGTSNSDNTNNFGNHKLFIGRRNCASCLPPTGEFYLAEVVIYNRVLTGTEKNAVYTYLNGRYNVNNTVNVAGVCQQPALWLKADAGVTTSGTSVTQWADQSGNGNNVTQATAAAQPQLQTNVFNGQPALFFNAGTTFLNNSTQNVVTAGAPRTVFAVVKSLCSSDGITPIVFRRTASVHCLQTYSGTNYIYTDGSISNITTTATLFDTIRTKQTLATYISGGTGTGLQYRQNGVSQPTSGTVTLETGTTGFTIGRREDNAYANYGQTEGWIAEIIVYNSQLNATDIAAVENYLAIKYGTNNPPSVFAISSAKPVTVTSTLSGTLAANINDDNVCTAWASTAATAQSAAINLQAPTTVSSVYLNVGSSITLTNAVIETSPDNTTWTTATTFSGAYSNYNNIFLTFPAVANVQYVRVRIPASSGSFPRFNEFVVNPNFINNNLKGITPMILNAGANPFGSTVTNGQTLYASKAATYQWQRNGIDIPGATNQSYTVTNYGNFSVVVTHDICIGSCNVALTSNAVANALVHTSTPTCNILFDGTTAASVSVPNNALINPTAAFTYEAWFKANNNVGVNRAIISKGITTNYSASILLEASTGKIVGEFYTGASLKTLKSLIGYNDNAWHHVAYTYDGANIKLYIDGTLEGTLAATGAVSTVTQDFTIGKYSASNGFNFWGSIDEVRVWNTARTQLQINNTIYTQLIGNEANLQAYYNFSDTTYNGQGQLIKNKCTTTGTVLDGFTEGNATYPQYSCTNVNLPTAVPPSCNIIFNGTSRVDVGSTGPLTPTGTISFWMKPTIITSYPDPLSLGSNAIGIRFEFAGSSFYSVVGSSLGAYTITNILTASQGEWYHIALTWNVAANKIKVYANGKFVQEATNTYWPAGNLNLTLGEGYINTRYFNGSLDDVALFNTEKTFTEIQNMYLGTPINPADASLRALYNFNTNTVNGTGVVVPNQANVGGLNGTTVGTCGFPKFNCALNSSIALDKPTSASSVYSGTSISNVVDGNACTIWTANATNVGNWGVDLETPVTLNNLLVILSMNPDGILNGYVETSADGITWTNVYDLSSPSHFNFENIKIQFASPIPNVRFIKINYTFSSSWASLREVLVNQNLINESVKDMTPILLNADGSFKQGQATIGEVLFSSKANTYQWKRNGVNIVGATNQSYTVPNVGNYSVTVTYACTTNCNGALSTPTVPSGLSANAIPTCGLVQNGTAAGITIPHNTLINPTAAFTYEAFFKAGTDVTVARKILSKGAAANYSVALGLQQTSGKIQGEFVIGGTLRNILSLNAYNDNQWHHVACTYDGVNINLYVDGQLDNALAATGAVAANTSDMEIGRNIDGGGTQPFIGNIDEVRIWNVARTPAQILAALGTVLVGNESGLQAYYHFNNVLFNGQNRVVTNNCSAIGIPLNGITFGTATTPTFSCATPSFTEPDCNINLSVAGNIVTVPHNAALDVNQFSIAAYIKTSQAAAADIHIVSKENVSAQNFRLSINNGKARISFNGTEFAEGTTNVNDNVWHYIAGTYDGTTLRIYVDGTQQASFGTVATPSINTDNVIIGQSYSSSNQYIGSLDEISIWNKALSAIEVSSNIGNSLAGTETGLKAYYNFNDNPIDGAAQVVPNKAVATGTTINGTTAGTSTTPVFNCSEVFVNTPTCSIMLNGKDNAIVNNASTIINTSQNYSIEMILKPNSLYEHAGPYYVTNWGSLIQDRLVMRANTGGGNGSGLNISAAANGIGVWAQYGSYNHYRVLFYPSLIKDWVHFAVVSNGNSLKLFVNGKLAGSVANAGSTFNISSFLGAGFAGNIAEIRMWDKTLSNDEVHNNINTVYTGAEVGLKSLYRFNSNTLNGANRTVANLGSLGATNALTTRGNTQTPVFTCANYVPNTTDEAVARPGSGNVYNNYTYGNASMNSWGTMSNTGTIAMWVKAASLTPAVQGIFSTATLSGNAKGNRGIRLDLESNGYIFVNFGDDNSTTAGTTNRWGITVAPIEVNRWYHVAITWNKTTNTWSSIVNGIATQSNVPNTKWPTVLGDVNVGMGFDLGVNFNYGQVDELVHYNIALTETQVRDRLTRKMTSTDPLWSNLQNYYRFDQSGSGNFYTGTSALYDYKGTKHGMIYAASDFQVSSAPIGDVSAHQYAGVGSGASVAFGTTARDTITAQVTAGTNVQGIQVYGVNEIPNTQAGQFILANNNRYAGVFVIGDTNQVSYNAKYSYNLNPYFLGSYVHDKLLLYKREHNAITGWGVDLSSTIDSVNKKYFATGKNSEFMLGYSPYPVRPRLGNDTTLYVVCDNETYNLLPVYIPATDGHSTAWNAPNPSAAPMGNWRLIATSYFGFKDTAFATVAQDIRVWTGAVSNDWHNIANWNIPKLPTAITHVVIPVSTPNPCLISTADAFAASMQVKAAGNFNIAAPYNLVISGKCVVLPPWP